MSIQQTSVKRLTNKRVWQDWGVMEYESSRAGVVADAKLSGTLRSYLLMGRSPAGLYRLGEDSDNLGIYVYETDITNGEWRARAMTLEELEKSGL